MDNESPKAGQFEACLDIAITAGLDRVWVEQKGKGYEFGDDPAFVKWQISLGEYLLCKSKALVESVSIERDGLAIANFYFALKRELDDFKKWLEGVEESEFGSRENSRELKKGIEAIMAANIKVWQIINREL